MRTPDFLIVGAARAGTTSLHYYLKQHPKLFLPSLKEPCFFIFDGQKKKYVNGKFAFAVRDFNNYSKLFSKVMEDKVMGEISTPYLYLYEKSISTIKNYFSDYRKIKIVILLRNPVERAFSQYMWRVRDGREPLSFEDAIKAEPKRMKNNFSFDYFYVDRGFYFQQVKSYLDNFDDVYIMLYEDFKNDSQTELKKLCTFLNADCNFSFEEEEYRNKSFLPKSNLAGRLFTSESKLKYRLLNLLSDRWRGRMKAQLEKWNSRKGKEIEMGLETKKNLIKIYRDDILKLQSLINRDLLNWLK